MVTSLLEHESIVTTEAKAKALRPLADKMITLGKRGDLHARRQALSVIRSKRTAKRLFDEIAPRYSQREGGYTRVVKTGPRKGDCAAMAVIELVEKSEEKPRAKPAEESKGLRGKLRDTLKSK
jgi:large subunit ribosomal protein L17